MKKSTKIFLIVSAALIVLGVALMGIGYSFGGNLNRSRLKPVHHSIRGEFTSIDIALSSADVIISPSGDDKAYAVCMEDGKTYYNLKVENGILKLSETDRRNWFDNMGVFYGKRTVNLYLPKAEYDDIKVLSASGDIACEKGDFTFKNAKLNSSSGEIKFGVKVLGDIKAATSSGDIEIKGSTPKSVGISTDSGEITLSGVVAGETVKADAKSGKIKLKDCKADNVNIKSNSGEIKMTDCNFSSVVNIKSTSGDIKLSYCDAAAFKLESNSGDVGGILLSNKIFNVKTNSGNVKLPDSVKDGGECEIKTKSGDIEFFIVVKAP